VYILQSSQHADHVMRDVTEVADERRCLLDDAASIINRKLTEYQEAYDRLGQWETDRATHREQLLNYINTSAEELKSLVDTKRQELGEEVEDLLQKRLGLIVDKRAAINHELRELRILLARYSVCELQA